MSKVCILSFPRYYNYGTFLQMYALQATLDAQGYQAELIDYDPYNDSGKQGAGKTSVLSGVRRALGKMKRYFKAPAQDTFTVGKGAQKARFEEFLKRDLKLGQRTYFSADELNQMPPAADAVIVGSDQVWHPEGHYKDAAYFLSFVPRAKRIAYAPSFGVSQVPEHASEWLAEHIEGIPNLSVREHAGADIIKQLTGRDAQVVLDPAYLLGPTQWSAFAGQKDAMRPAGDEPYLLCYFLESDLYMREAALRLAKLRGLKPIMIPVHANDQQGIGADFAQLMDVGPREFVRLIRDAAMICTDSFHGTSFSILFNRPFLTFRRYDNPAQAANHSRLESILTATGLKGRVADKENAQQDWEEAPDFATANARIEALRADSMAYLQGALNNALKAA